MSGELPKVGYVDNKGGKLVQMVIPNAVRRYARNQLHPDPADNCVGGDHSQVSEQDDHQVVACGQMYVALSRVRGRENVKVTGFEEKYASCDMDVN